MKGPSQSAQAWFVLFQNHKCVTQGDCEKLETPVCPISEHPINALWHICIWDFNLGALGVPERASWGL